MTVRFPIAVDAGVDLVGLVHRQLQLSKLNRRETLVVLDSRGDPFLRSNRLWSRQVPR